MTAREAYVSQVLPSIERGVVGRYARPGHPCLGAEDLLQDAIEALLVVWRKLHGVKPLDELRRIGWTAAVNRIKTRASRYRRGESRTLTTSLDASWNGEDGQAVEACVSDDRGVEDSYFWFGLEEMKAGLSSTALVVFGELVEPGAVTCRETLRLTRRADGKAGNHARRAERLAIAKSLQLPEATVRDALAEVRASARKIFLSGKRRAVSYRILKASQPLGQGDEEMGGKTTEAFVPSLDDIAGDPLQASAAAGDSAAGQVPAVPSTETPARKRGGSAKKEPAANEKASTAAASVSPKRREGKVTKTKSTAKKAGAAAKAPAPKASAAKKPETAKAAGDRRAPGSSLEIVRKGLKAGLAQAAIVEKLKASGIKSADPWDGRVEQMIKRIKQEEKQEQKKAA